ncbi:MAG: methyltransferase domain-containing protein [Phycisphaera sp.]|nr:methyltransferase domain-containing protein [Phycisphaera sp.]
MPRTIPWRARLLNKAYGLPFADAILKRRAQSMIDRSRVMQAMRPGGVYLDVGSGTGHIIERLARQTAELETRFVGIDLFWKPIGRVTRRLRDKAPGRAVFTHASATALSMPDASCDAVTCFYVLHHIPDMLHAQVLDEIHRVLKVGGTFHLLEDTPTDEASWARQERWDRRVNFESRSEKHYYRWAGDWPSLLEQHGLKLTHREDFEEDGGRDGMIHHTAYVTVKEG